MKIEAEHLTKFYGPVLGLNDVSLKIESGVHGLLGPNGAGKSTFMKIITGQIKQSAGSIRVLDQPIWANPKVYRDIGYAPEQDAYYDYMTGLDFVETLCRLHGFNPARAREMAVEAIDDVGMKEAMERKIGEYSKGMRQRIKIAQAIAHQPSLIILDEPLSGTDPVARRTIIEMVRKKGEEGTCIILASHILHEVEQTTDNFILIYRGRTLASGNVHDIRELMNEFPHRISIRCSDVCALSQKIIKHLQISGLEIENEKRKIVVQTLQPREFYDKLPAIVEESGAQLYEMTSADDNLESVFQYLIGVE